MLIIMKHRGRLWIVLAGLAVLIAGHGVVLSYVSSHLALSMSAIAGVTALVLVMHLGLLGPLYTVCGTHSVVISDNAGPQNLLCRSRTGQHSEFRM
jgi:hypothetical protein